jgi:hypothetical protein
MRVSFGVYNHARISDTPELRQHCRYLSTLDLGFSPGFRELQKCNAQSAAFDFGIPSSIGF